MSWIFTTFVDVKLLAPATLAWLATFTLEQQELVHAYDMSWVYLNAIATMFTEAQRTVLMKAWKNVDETPCVHCGTYDEQPRVLPAEHGVLCPHWGHVVCWKSSKEVTCPSCRVPMLEVVAIVRRGGYN